jgi:hypothetical protein
LSRFISAAPSRTAARTTGADILAAADHQSSGRSPPSVRGTGSALQSEPESADARQLGFDLRHAGRIDGDAAILQQGQRGAFTGQLGGIGPHDAGTVAGEIDARHAAAGALVAHRQVRALQAVELETATQQISQLRFRTQGITEADGIACNALLGPRLATRACQVLATPDQRLHTGIAFHTQHPRVRMHRHAVQLEPGEVVDALGQQGRLPQHGGQCRDAVGQAAAVEHAATRAPALAY